MSASILTTPVPDNSTPSRFRVEKPESVNVTLYVPGCRLSMRYCPVPSVIAVRVFSIRTGLATSTLTPGSTPPEASLTRPAIAACAKALVGTTSTAEQMQNSFTNLCICPPVRCRPLVTYRARYSAQLFTVNAHTRVVVKRCGRDSEIWIECEFAGQTVGFQPVARTASASRARKRLALPMMSWTLHVRLMRAEGGEAARVVVRSLASAIACLRRRVLEQDAASLQDTSARSGSRTPLKTLRQLIAGSAPKEPRATARSSQGAHRSGLTGLGSFNGDGVMAAPVAS